MSGLTIRPARAVRKDTFIDEVQGFIPTCGAEIFSAILAVAIQREFIRQKIFHQSEGAGLLTIFSIPKAFKGHIGIIQRNAIRSWTKLEPRPEIILLGNDDGTAEVAREFGLRHLPNVATSDHGTPLLSDLFRQAEAAASSSWMCYVNADILLLGDFAGAFETVRQRMPKFLMVSKRINLDVPEMLTFEAGWEPRMKARRDTTGVDGDYTNIDIFVFPKGMYGRVPDFAIGRLWFDHWLIKAVREQNLPVVDVSLAAPLLHQNHDYNHVSGGKEQIWRGEEAERNFKLYDGAKNSYTLLDVTHELTAGGAMRRVRFRKHIAKIKHWGWELFVHRTAGLRDAVGLRRKFWKKSAAAPHN
jgi:hypothetical protein